MIFGWFVVKSDGNRISIAILSDTIEVKAGSHCHSRKTSGTTWLPGTIGLRHSMSSSVTRGSVTEMPATCSRCLKAGSAWLSLRKIVSVPYWGHRTQILRLTPTFFPRHLLVKRSHTQCGCVAVTWPNRYSMAPQTLGRPSRANCPLSNCRSKMSALSLAKASYLCFEAA